MKRWITVPTGVIAAVALSATVAFAAPQTVKPDTKKPAPTTKGTKCPVCGMFLAKSKTANSTVPVRLTKGGPIMYCCPKCKMPAAVLVKTPGKK